MAAQSFKRDKLGENPYNNSYYTNNNYRNNSNYNSPNEDSQYYGDSESSDNDGANLVQSIKDKKARDDASNAALVSNAADVASKTNNPYAKAIGKGIQTADRFSGGRASKALGKTLTVANKLAPGAQAFTNMAMNNGTAQRIASAVNKKNSGTSSNPSNQSSGGINSDSLKKDSSNKGNVNSDSLKKDSSGSGNVNTKLGGDSNKKDKSGTDVKNKTENGYSNDTSNFIVAAFSKLSPFAKAFLIVGLGLFILLLIFACIYLVIYDTLEKIIDLNSANSIGKF